jgi:5'-3' exoribonuclease 2
MGVPAFFRWLLQKYPKVVVDMLEQRSAVINGTEIPINLLEENPNGIEYDNLYVDMNGLIHPCSHPEDRESPLTEPDMYLNIMKYVDRLVAAVRPRRLLYLAIDGVAPRAKMNQQRARRFRSAQEARERKEMLNEVISELRSLGLDPPAAAKDAWDSNVITPGTPFMDKLSLYMKYYILSRINSNPLWKNIKVIFSDSSEPGEGEHKIMKFIRSQRCQPGYDPNQRHILHGLDADLIMLALATHEPYFTILREEVIFGRPHGPKEVIKSDAQKLLDSKSNREGAAASAINPHDEWIYAKKLQCLHINILREYLAVEFSSLTQTVTSFPYNFEKVIDDFVFLCFFVGNDFLPHLPSLDIRDGAIDFLLEVYKDLLPSMGDYITGEGGDVHLRQVYE